MLPPLTMATPAFSCLASGGVSPGLVAYFFLCLCCVWLHFMEISSVQHIPKQDVVKLSESTYLLWKHQVSLIIDGYGLLRFITDEGGPPVTVATVESGNVEDNSTSTLYQQQDKLLASWLLTTVSTEVLPHLTGFTSVISIWNTISRLFGARSSAKVSSLRHSSPIAEHEQVSVILVGLSMEFESVIAIASRDNVSLDVLTEMLLDCEARHKAFLTEEISANLISKSTGENKVNELEDSDITIVSKHDEACTNAIIVLIEISLVLIMAIETMKGGSQLKLLLEINSSLQMLIPGSFHQGVPWYPPLPTHVGVDSVKNSQVFMASPTGFASTTSLPRPAATTSSIDPVWYPDTGATHHVANDSSLLNTSMTYTDLWHRRLGHSSVSVVKTVMKTCNVASNESSLASVCNACLQSKAHKLPFTSSLTEYKAPFQLVVSDVWGPTPFVSSDGYAYYVSFIDVQFGVKIKSLQSDGGGEYLSLRGWFLTNGVQHRLSCPSTFEQNGKAERKHRHVVEMGLALLSQASLPLKFWSYSFISAVYLINRLPTKVLNGKSPFQVLHQQSPDYSMLRVFSCACFPLVRPFNHHKLEYRSKQCVFLGYSPSHKGYRCLDDAGRMFVSRHVIFDENKFPYDACKMTNQEHADSHVSTWELPILFAPQVQTQQGWVDTTSSMNSMQDESMQDEEGADSQPNHEVNSGGATESQNAHATNSEDDIPAESSSITVPIETTLPHIDMGADCSSILNIHPMRTRKEYEALLRNKTWSLVSLPSDRRAVHCIDFHEVFSPVVKPVIVRVILTLALSKGWQLRQVDINNAFLNGVLTEEVYMTQPPGFEFGDEKLVCKLHKAIYGLKQAPRAWFDSLRSYLESEGFVVAKSDSSLFIQKREKCLMYLLVYVDDIILTGSNPSEVQIVIDKLHAKFALKDLGTLNFFLGIEVKYESGGVVLCQQKYIHELLQRNGFESANGLPTPMVTNCKLSVKDENPIEKVTQFRSIVGALQYVVITRPDIAFAVNHVCQFMQAPLDTHFQAMKRILRYLQGTIDFGLRFLGSSRLSLAGFADASWGADVDDRRSTFGFCIYFGGNLVSWSSRKQQVVARSTAEAEYRSVACAAAEMVLLESLLSELHIVSHGKPTLWCDNSSAVAVCANPVLHSKFKHVELDLFFVREMVIAGKLQVHEVPAFEQAEKFTSLLLQGESRRYIVLLVSSVLIITWLNLSNDVYDFCYRRRQEQIGIGSKFGWQLFQPSDEKDTVLYFTRESRSEPLIAAYLSLAIVFIGLSWISVDAGSMRSLILLACAIFCGYVYQCPPFRLSYQGLGEPLCFAAFGPFATTAFYLLLGSTSGMIILPLTRTVLSASLLVGLTTSLILFCSHFHQVEEDISVGKMSPLIGTERGSMVVEGAVFTLYSLLFALGLFRTLPITCIVLCALTLPIGKLVVNFVEETHEVSCKLARQLDLDVGNEDYLKGAIEKCDCNHLLQDKGKIFMANYYCVRLHSLFGAAMIAGLVSARILGKPVGI
ncbi:1,4-dihydroxy-2-naphthoate polyprenyltransferase [Hibiscus syriacus]|uniref:1,4-dihydroxy-2-naphthoate polyprenyltransferase n=1 Tax=Hibiscus syriacus TaxID=106335 RepID=A0A6A2YCA5_HIBSY|nr:1,4-dihydroxy-2-naphthoate polyprenyltransferase [Hibiscus syriacus]